MAFSDSDRLPRNPSFVCPSRYAASLNSIVLKDSGFRRQEEAQLHQAQLLQATASLALLVTTKVGSIVEFH
jgi:hypothetical protein